MSPQTPLFRVDELATPHTSPISFSVAPGECLSVSGPSGAGKSLLLRAIADLDPNRGRVWLDGVERASLSAPEWRRQVALLPAEPAWWADRVDEHFEQASPFLDRLGFPPDVMSWSVGRLSSGERQRLGLLRLLERRPRVLLLDEPTANLDPEGTRRVEQLVRDYLDEHRACAVWVSHDRAQRERVAQRDLALSPSPAAARAVSV
jgi:ABC-type iron transport system FetAB ATPase subunit